MKKILLIMILFTALIYPQIKVSTMDSITTLVTTDLFWINHDIGGSTFGHRQLSWSNLRTNTNAYALSLRNTFPRPQTFNGATFAAGDSGTVTFADSVVNTGTSYFNRIYPTTSSTSQLGTAVSPYQTIWANIIRLPNTEANDSVSISYDDSTITFNKTISVGTLNVTGDLTVPDSVQITGIGLSQYLYTPSFVTDSVVTISSIQSSIEIRPPGSMGSPGIEKITMAKAGNGQLLVITNAIAVTIVFQDSEADGNLYLASDFSMAQWDALTLMYNSNISKWVELSRSDN